MKGIHIHSLAKLSIYNICTCKCYVPNEDLLQMTINHSDTLWIENQAEKNPHQTLWVVCHRWSWVTLNGLMPHSVTVPAGLLAWLKKMEAFITVSGSHVWLYCCDKSKRVPWERSDAPVLPHLEHRRKNTTKKKFMCCLRVSTHLHAKDLQSGLSGVSEFSFLCYLKGLVQLGSIIGDSRRHQGHNQTLEQPAELRLQRTDQVLVIIKGERQNRNNCVSLELCIMYIL